MSIIMRLPTKKAALVKQLVLTTLALASLAKATNVYSWTLTHKTT